MDFFNNLFKKSKSEKNTNKTVGQVNNIQKGLQQQYFNLTNAKIANGPVSKQELINIFNTYFVPNPDFYSVPGSDNFKAYFGAINAARDEIISNQRLFMQATGWSMEELIELLNSNVPDITNALICGLIYKLGEFAVVKSVVYCVDFSETIPNCVALYLLLIAQKLPIDKRSMVIDAGEGTNKGPLMNAINALKGLDENWNYNIY